ncbi:MAG: hypothetical protein J6J62_02730 [Oscillospiraceae bacterium]|nr:hypothetical protein [Oscillospiraceae bacterium]
MLDIEIYGLIIALGILLAMLLVGVFCISINIDNIRLHKKYKGDESMRDFVNRETVKGLILILLEVFLACALLLVKMKMFS